MSIATEIKATENKVRELLDDLIENHIACGHNGQDVYHHRHWEIASKLIDAAIGDIDNAINKLSRAANNVEKAEA